MQPTCSIGAFLAFGGTFTLSRFSVSVPFRRTRLMASRWAAVACEQILCGCDSPICAFVSRVEPSFWGNRPMLDWQTDAQKSQSGLFVLFDAHSWQPILAAQHRVATDAPVGAFKIRPILRESLCHVSCLSSPGARLNAIRWAALNAIAHLHSFLRFTCS